MSFKETIHYEMSSDIMGCVAVQLIKKEEDYLFSGNIYNGTLVNDRHLVNKVIDDTIENIQDLETDVQEFFSEE